MHGESINQMENASWTYISWLTKGRFNSARMRGKACGYCVCRKATSFSRTFAAQIPGRGGVGGAHEGAEFDGAFAGVGNLEGLLRVRF